MEQVAVIGMSGRFPGAADVDAFWQLLLEGGEGIRDLNEQELRDAGATERQLADPRFVRAAGALAGVEDFDAGFFGFTAREAELTDPQHRVFLECAWEALERAGHGGARGGRVGVFAGTNLGTYLLFHLLPRPDLLEAIGPLALKHGNDKDYLATRTSYKLDLRGPSLTVQTGCSTSLVAVHLACQSLLGGECDMALAGGVNIAFPQHGGYPYQPGSILSPDGRCRPFDAGARGTVLTNGAAVVLLRRLSDAVADGDPIHAVIRGTAINNDGAAKVGFVAPSFEGQTEVIREALAVAGVDPAEVSYVEAHGTGTELGDPVEIAALRAAFGDAPRAAPCAVGSVKANVGHTNVAAGVTGLVKAALALEHGIIPGTLHFHTPNPALELGATFRIADRTAAWPAQAGPRRAGVSSFGMGGTNAHAVLEEPPAQPARPSRRRYHVLGVSARSASAVEQALDRLATRCERPDPPPLADAAYTLAVGRQTFPWRAAVVAADPPRAVSALRERSAQRPVEAADAPGVVFLFPGQGAQYAGMGLALYESEPVYRRAFDRVIAGFAPHLDFDLHAALASPPGSGGLDRTDRAQAALFAVEWAAVALWASWGVRPDALIGHSLGEYTAAVVGGTLTVEDACALVAARARAMLAVEPGSMLAVPLPAAALEALLDPACAVAADNGPALSVASGPTDRMEALRARLADRGVEARPLRTSHAFHSPMMEAAVPAFREALRGVTLSPPRQRWISNVTGAPIEDADATDPEYWVRHLRSPVRFGEGAARVAQRGWVLLEVGPGRSLSSIAAPGAAVRRIATLPSARDDRPADLAALEALARVWEAGLPVRLDAPYADEQRRRVILPTYPFERRRHFVGAPTASAPAAPAPTPPAQAAPPEALQERLAALWQRVLGVATVAPGHDFFELGGHSLVASQLAAHVRAELGIEMSVREVFEAPTLAAMAARLERSRRDGPPAPTDRDLRADVVLADDIVPPAVVSAAAPPREILLTGATGYVGSFLLRELLDRTDARVHCLVRAPDAAAGLERLLAALAPVGPGAGTDRERVIAVPGDLGEPRFGLGEPGFRALGERIDAVFHAGALVNFALPYDHPALQAVNVRGTAEVLRLASRRGAPVHHVSTTAVFHSPAYRSGDRIHEDQEAEHSHGLRHGYAQTKWVAEQLVVAARERGLPVTVFRPGNVIGDRRTGLCNLSDHLPRMIRGCVELGAVPDADLTLDATPIDHVVQAIVRLASSPDALGSTFHPVNPAPPHLTDLVAAVREAGFPLEVVPYGAWRARLFDPNAADNALQPLAFLFPAVPEGEPLSPRVLHFDAARVARCEGLASPLVDREVLAACLAAFVRTGFLPAPPGAR